VRVVCRDLEFPFASCKRPVCLHQPAYPFLASPDIAPGKLAPKARPAIGFLHLGEHGPDVENKGRVADTPKWLIRPFAACPVLMVAAGATARTLHCVVIGQTCSCPSIKVYLTATPTQDTPSLFSGCRAPSACSPVRPSDAQFPSGPHSPACPWPL
jgi:hypothetical protein